MFTRRVRVIKLSKIAHFLVFSDDDSKKSSHHFGKIFNAPERSYDPFQKLVQLIDFGVAIREILRVKVSEKLLSHQTNTQILYFKRFTSC